MKQLLTVMAIMLFASLTQGFIVPGNTIATNTIGRGILKSNNEWKQTTWVNPWHGVTPFRKKQKRLTDSPVSFNFITSNSPTFNKVAIGIDGTEPFLNGVGGSYFYNASYSFHIEVDIPPCCAPAYFILDVTDYDIATNTFTHIFFEDESYYVNETFYVQPGHEYDIQLRVD